MATKLRNPHYIPDVAMKVFSTVNMSSCVQVTLVNFSITMEGMQDQLLAIVVGSERPELEQKMTALIQEEYVYAMRCSLTLHHSAENKRRLQEIENKILQVLDASENILADESAIEVLADSKRIANEIGEKQRVTQDTQVKITAARQVYASIADYAAVLFFCITDLASVC